MTLLINMSLNSQLEFSCLYLKSSHLVCLETLSLFRNLILNLSGFEQYLAAECAEMEQRLTNVTQQTLKSGNWEINECLISEINCSRQWFHMEMCSEEAAARHTWGDLGGFSPPLPREGWSHQLVTDRKQSPQTNVFSHPEHTHTRARAWTAITLYAPYDGNSH